MRPIRKLDTRMGMGVKQLILPPGQNNKATENQVLKALALLIPALAGPALSALPYLLRKYTASACRLMTTCYPFGGSERSERLKNLISAACIWQRRDLKVLSISK